MGDERANAITQIHRLIEEEGLTKQSWWMDEVEKFRLCICIQLTDLRSQIIKKTCALSCSLANAMGIKFEDHIENLLYKLFSLLYNKIKIIAVSAHKCIKSLLLKVHTPQSLPALLQGLQDEHPPVRSKCCEYLTQYLSQMNSDSKPLEDPRIFQIQLSIQSVVTDSDATVREECRILFKIFSHLFPKRGKQMFEEFPPAVQKQIKADLDS